jgi:hypothetical protein
MHRRPRRSSALALVLVIVGAGNVTPAAIAADEPAYALPAPAGTTLLVAQGNADATFRGPDERYAFDFTAADGSSSFPVVAARGGTVMATRGVARGGRCTEPSPRSRPDCWRDVNYVLIDHGDGTSGLYLHLERGRLPVRAGDVVSTGQPLGNAGDSGWTERVGLQFQVQRTPAWNQQGGGGWFLTESVPVSFADAGVPPTGSLVTSANPGPRRPAFRFERRPVDLPATLPFQIDADRSVAAAYDADSPDGYGLEFAPLVITPDVAVAPAASPAAGDPGGAAQPPAIVDPGTIVRPLFGGELVFAGCASGSSASLGGMVAVRLALEDGDYTAVLGHLSEVEPSLLDVDPVAELYTVGPNEFLGRYGATLAPGEVPECPAADPTERDLFAAILRDATVTPEGEIVGGTPVSPEPLVGALAYEGFDWWRGPVTSTQIGEDAGRPRASWTSKTPEHASHIAYGRPITLAARVRDASAITQVRFRAYYPAWPRPAASEDLTSFRPRTTWRQLALCTPPQGASLGKVPGTPCRWNGDSLDAVVSFTWDPATAPPAPSAPWLPRATPATSRDASQCVPVSLAVEVVDEAGHVASLIGRLPVPSACDERRVDRARNARVLYLDPLSPPEPPQPKGDPEDRGWPPVYAPDPLDGAIVWKDRSDNEDGFRVYARRSWFEVDCSITDGPWVLVKELPLDTTSYRPQHTKVVRSIDVPEIKGVPGTLVRWEYAVTAYNLAEETKKVPVGGFIGGSEAFCDPGLELPPDA